MFIECNVIHTPRERVCNLIRMNMEVLGIHAIYVHTFHHPIATESVKEKEQVAAIWNV